MFNPLEIINKIEKLKNDETMSTENKAQMLNFLVLEFQNNIPDKYKGMLDSLVKETTNINSEIKNNKK